jgi:hypothetical protein
MTRSHDENGVVKCRPETATFLPSLAASLAFCAWCGLLCYPMITMQVDLSVVHQFNDPRSPTVLICQAIGLVLFITTICVSHFGYFGLNIRRFNFPQLGIFLIIYLSFPLQLHDTETAILTGIFYNTLILVAALTLSVIWTIPPEHLERCISVASVILCLFGICAIAILGWPGGPLGRNVGSIQPNLFAAPLLVAFIFSLFRPGIVSVIVRVLSLGMIVLVSSRFALIGCIVATAVFELTFRPLSPTKILTIVAVMVAALILWPEIKSVMAIDDSDRGLSSGFTGRDQLWYKAMAAISDHPFGIGFKRAIFDEAGHNGYLKTILEFGVAGGGLIIFFMACNIALAGFEAIVSLGNKSRQHRFASARFAGLVALSFGAFFQPQLFSLGDVFGISVLFLLFKPKWIARMPHKQPGQAKQMNSRIETSRPRPLGASA